MSQLAFLCSGSYLVVLGVNVEDDQGFLSA